MEGSGDPGARDALAKVLLAGTAPPIDRVTHGFHAYAARMHPAIAARALATFGGRNATVLDPFVGSGTVIVEAMLGGHTGIGSDLGPLAVRIAAVKTRLTREEERRRFIELARVIGEASEERVRARDPIRAALAPKDANEWSPHVLKELAGLLAEIRALGDDEIPALEVVFSAIVMKFSRRVADTSEEQIDRRLRKGLVTEFFVRKATELAERWRALAHEVPRGAKSPRIFLSDVRALPGAFPPVDLVVTSPPYGGTYDYVDHHRLRMAWLGLDASALGEHEIGSRRASSTHDARARFRRELTGMMNALGRVVRKGGGVILLIGDADIAGEALRADDEIARAAEDTDLRPIARASGERPDPRRGRSGTRFEHLLLLERS